MSRTIWVPESVTLNDEVNTFPTHNPAKDFFSVLLPLPRLGDSFRNGQNECNAVKLNSRQIIFRVLHKYLE